MSCDRWIAFLDAPVGKIGSEQFRLISRKDPTFFLIEDIQGFVALICLNKGLPGSIGPCCSEIGYCGRFQSIQAVGSLTFSIRMSLRPCGIERLSAISNQSTSNLTPWASGSVRPKLIVLVARRM